MTLCHLISHKDTLLQTDISDFFGSGNPHTSMAGQHHQHMLSSQEKITRLLFTPRFIAMFTSWQLVHILSEKNPIQIHFNIILLSVPRTPKWSLPYRFSGFYFVCICHFCHTCYMFHPSHPPWFYHPNSWWTTEIMKLFLQPPVSSSLLGPYVVFNTLYSGT
jgi:hypothetical protein